MNTKYQLLFLNALRKLLHILFRRSAEVLFILLLESHFQDVGGFLLEPN